ncbi:hypothetical protein CMO84_01645, partial [Candidatus Woesearchaeota archaeon]|nr:hypothetical protein [Candidatus Woesearchaeota archaeon]
HYVAEIEAAKKYPSAQTLERLSDALKISPSELFADVTSGATAFQRHKEMTALSRELRAELNGRIDAVTKKHLSPPSRDSRE